MSDASRLPLITHHSFLITHHSLLLSFHQLLHLIIPNRTLRRNDHGRGAFEERWNGAADDGGAVAGGFAAEDHARRLDGRDDFHLDGGRADRRLRQALARGDAYFD